MLQLRKGLTSNMELNDLLMLVLTCLNLILVSFVSIHSIIDGNRGKITRGKKVWLNTEVLSRTKIDEHSLPQNRVNGILPHIRSARNGEPLFK